MKKKRRFIFVYLFCFVFYFWGGDEDEGRRKGVAIFDTATHTSYPAICNSLPMGYGLGILKGSCCA
jgi:hypothetical protein